MKNNIWSRAGFLFSTFLPHFAASLAFGSVGPLALFFQTEFAVSRVHLGSLTSAHSLGCLIMALVSGSIIERSGIRKWFLLCPVLSGVFFLLFLGVTSYYQAIAIFLILGIIFSFINPATTKAILVGFSQVGRGTAMALKQTGTPAGVFLASVSIPVIAVLAGWNWGLLFVGFVNLVVGVFAWLLYGEEDSRAGSALCHQEKSNLKKDFSELLHNRNFLLISFLQGIFNIGLFVIQAYLILYLVESLSYSAIYAGFIMAVTQFCGIIGRIMWGLLSDFVFSGKRVPTLQIAGFTTTLGLFGLAVISSSTPAWIIWVIASLVGAGTIGFAGTSILLRAELTPKNLVATSTGLGMAIASWGVLLGPPVFGFIVDVNDSYKMAWVLLAAVSLAGTLLLGAIRERKSEDKDLEYT